MRGRAAAGLALAAALALSGVAPRAGAAGAGAEGSSPGDAELRAWVEEWKRAPRGPFQGIRWFCADGSIQPAQPYACQERGGGRQHGLLEPRVGVLRKAGFPVANLLAELDPERFTGAAADLEDLRVLLVERFLVDWDDGWIFRAAQRYRGALQIEDEEAGAERLLRALLADPEWHRAPRFFLLREAARLLPVQGDPSSAAHVRAWAARLADRDPAFAALRTRIHSTPGRADAGRVREHARQAPETELRSEYLGLATAIEAQFDRRDAVPGAQAAAARLADRDAAAKIGAAAARVGAAGSDGERRLLALGDLLAALRDELPGASDPAGARAVLAASLLAEDAWFATAQEVLAGLPDWSRRRRAALLEVAASAAYGAGLIGRRQREGVLASLQALSAPELRLSGYRRELAYLARLPEWAGRSIAFHFGRAEARLTRIEPLAVLFGQDRLRASPLLFAGSVLDSLALDANRLAGVSSEVFGRPSATDLRALNPGLARGRLLAASPGEELTLPRDAIALLPETTADLAPVAGILTLGEGSSLSHVQLLARNLGVPNAVVRGQALAAVRARLGEVVVLAVSPGGTVQLRADAPALRPLFAARAEPDADLRIRPDLEKLDLLSIEPIPLSELRARDSGRVAGPKGANLGELRHFHPEAVPDGFVLPFGAFRALLDLPLGPGEPAVFDWMKSRYAAIRAEADPDARAGLEREFLARLRGWIGSVELPPQLSDPLRAALARHFEAGAGVFVRSDTNVEDLPGFTGAGLNRTVPNVVGAPAVLQAVREVWASPFTERAYAWRQAHMDQPEYVFPAVVVQRAFASEKSGVLVTVDLDTGDPGWLTIAVNEGVGGVVEGQGAESLGVPVDGGPVRYLAQATAPERSVLDPRGGILREPASGEDSILTREEVMELVRVAGELGRFPALMQQKDKPLPADVEFAFRGGSLALLQIRPFVESPRALRSLSLAELDAPLRERGGQVVDLDAVPAAEAP